MNKNLVNNFYERMYAEGREGRKPTGILGSAFMILRRYELFRITAASSLLEKGDNLLDLGCGNGNLISDAKKRKLFKRYYGIDLIGIVVKRAKKEIRKISGDLKSVYIKRASLDSKLPFKDKYFSVITCTSVLEHIFDPYFSIQEINRVLKKGGSLILEVPNLVWLPRRISVLSGRLPITGDEIGWDGGHLHYFTFKSLSDLLINNGFIIEYKGSTGIFPKLRNIWPSLLGGDILIKARKVKDRKHEY
jgi:ubiquinone/menaquinone biosynthesis C-methylase UbiE